MKPTRLEMRIKRCLERLNNALERRRSQVRVDVRDRLHTPHGVTLVHDGFPDAPVEHGDLCEWADNLACSIVVGDVWIESPPPRVLVDPAQRSTHFAA